MKKVIRLNESDISRIVKRVISEEKPITPQPKDGIKKGIKACMDKYPNVIGFIGNLEVNNLMKLFYMNIAPDSLLTPEMKTVKANYKSMVECFKKIPGVNPNDFNFLG